MEQTTIWIAADHAGADVSAEIAKTLADAGYTVHNVGVQPGTEIANYSHMTDRVAPHVQAGEGFGILICGSGCGVSMRANRYPGVRAALVWNEETACLARAHGDANILCLGARQYSLEDMQRWVHLFLKTPFDGERHTARVKALDEPLATISSKHDE